MLPKGYKHSKETRRKMAEARREQWKDPVYRAKLSKALKGRKGNKGFKHSEETKKKMSESKRKQWANPEYRKRVIPRLKNGMRGCHHTDEAKKKISDAMRGKNNPYYRARVLNGTHMKGETHPCYGKHKPEVVCDKIRKSLSGRIRPDLSGKNNGMWGVPAPHGKSVRTKSGHMVRSTWERDVCDWFFSNRINYQYEPRTFEFDGLTYTPDIYVPIWDTYFEIKGWWDARSVEQVCSFIDNDIGILMIIDKENIDMFREV